VAEPKLETILDPPDEVTRAIRDGLGAYNARILGDQDWCRVAIVVRSDEGQVLGGLLGSVSWDWLHVSHLWLDESVRGRDIGSELLRRAEALAVARGVTHAYLETTSFQALEFYLKNGYKVFGRLEGRPRGHTYYYLKKEELTATE